MLDFLFEGSRRLLERAAAHPVSNRKIRLWCCACARAMCAREKFAEADLALAPAEEWAETGREQQMPHCANKMQGLMWCYWPVEDAVREWSGEGVRIHPEKCNLLRDVIGNPWRHFATYPLDPQGQGRRVSTVGGEHGASIFRSDWVTADVITLAQSAYDERDRPCPWCKDAPQLYSGEQWPNFAKRCACKGTRRVPSEDGALAVDRLAILADALEEAGCGEVDCTDCLGNGCHPFPSAGRFVTCRTCGGSGRAPHPAPAHLRSPGTHVRGCWALDLILGKE